MGYIKTLYKIFLGTVAGDKTGAPARTAGQGLNENFDKIDVSLEQINNAAEKLENKAVDFSVINNVRFPTTGAVSTALASKANHFTTDETLYLDPNTNVLRGNVSTYTQTLTKTGSQIWQLDFEPTNFLVIHGRLNLFPGDYIFTPPTTFEILPHIEMEEGEQVRIIYERFGTQP